MKKSKSVVWIKVKLSRTQLPHLMRVCMGVAMSYMKSRRFCLINIDTLKVAAIDPDNPELLAEMYLKPDKNPTQFDNIIKYIQHSNITCFLVTNKESLPEKLTKKIGEDIICIYVTLSRKEFGKLTENNILKCFVDLSVLVRKKPTVITDIEWRL